MAVVSASGSPRLSSCFCCVYCNLSARPAGITGIFKPNTSFNSFRETINDEVARCHLFKKISGYFAVKPH